MKTSGNKRKGNKGVYLVIGWRLGHALVSKQTHQVMLGCREGVEVKGKESRAPIWLLDGKFD